MSLLAHHYARRRAALLTAVPELIWQHDTELVPGTPAITFGNGSWVLFFPALAYGGSAKYTTGMGAGFGFIVPAGGCTRCSVEGYQDENGSTFEVYRNDVPIFSGNGFATPAQRGVYADFAVAAGDLIRVVFTGAGSNSYPYGGNNAMYCDQIRFY
jgi:hypothetical protein